MTITIEEAEEASHVLATAAADCPIRQIKYELARRANEWSRAAKWAAEDEEQSVIELCMAVVPGMRVLHDEDGYMPVIRVLQGGLSLHVESARSPQGTYRNFVHPTSPVVVKA